jgi:hypothetical protein
MEIEHLVSAMLVITVANAAEGGASWDDIRVATGCDDAPERWGSHDEADRVDIGQLALQLSKLASGVALARLSNPENS